MPTGEDAQSQSALAESIAAMYATPPGTVANMLAAAGPALTPVAKAVGFTVNLIGPVYYKIFKLGLYGYEKLPFELIHSICGLGLAFCGGAYCSSVAAVDAFRMNGWAQTRAYLMDVRGELRNVWAGHVHDDDEARSDEEPYSELLRRKLRVTALSVKDPSTLAVAVGGLYTAWLAVQGTLRLEFAKTITLGLSIADLATPMAERLLLPVLAQLVPAEYKHWLPLLVQSAAKAVGVSLAWRLQVMVSAVHLALRGGLLFSRGLLRYAKKKDWLPGYNEDLYWDEAIGYAVAVAGLKFQWTYGFGLPFPANIVFWPLDVVEWYIRWTITSSEPIA